MRDNKVPKENMVDVMISVMYFETYKLLKSLVAPVEPPKIMLEELLAA